MASEFQREGTCGVRSVHWLDGAVHIIDQPALPLEFRTVACAGVEDVFNAIRSMTVRGAPAIGAAGAFGMALAARAAEWSDGCDRAAAGCGPADAAAGSPFSRRCTQQSPDWTRLGRLL